MTSYLHYGCAVWLLVFAACERASKPQTAPASSQPAHDTSSHHDEPAHATLRDRVRLEPDVVAHANIRTAPVVRERLVAMVELPGEIASDPDKTARVSALVSGRIESVNFKEGETVKKGDLLAIIKVPDIDKAKAAFTATNAKAVAARTNADRLQVLADKRLAANQELLAAKAEADALEAEAHAMHAQLTALGIAAGDGSQSQLALRAPLSGVVVARDAVVGQPISADRAIATIADLDEVWFLGRVFEKNLSQVQVGAPAEVLLNAYPKQPFAGSIEYLGKQIDPTARTVTARIRLPNQSGVIRLGLFGVARVSTREASQKSAVLVVPRSAVTEIGGDVVVFVRQADGDFDVHRVVLGDGALGKLEVVNGLREGEQVVIDGVFTLKSAILRGTLAEEE